MYPAEWAIANSARLNIVEFSTAFARAWSRIETRFLKLECWQAYRESEASESQAVYEYGDIETARELLEHEAEADRPLYEDVDRRGLEYARVRLVQEPLSAYLGYELLSYRIRADMGERIEVVRCGPALHLPDERHFDFLLFDRHTALVHDYGTGDVGLQTGGWLTHDPDAITGLEETISTLRHNAVPLQEYLASTHLD
jgi:hypothetical protein